MCTNLKSYSRKRNDKYKTITKNNINECQHKNLNYEIHLNINNTLYLVLQPESFLCKCTDSRCFLLTVTHNHNEITGIGELFFIKTFHYLGNGTQTKKLNGVEELAQL